jgi:hypothetical protein
MSSQHHKEPRISDIERCRCLYFFTSKLKMAKVKEDIG